MKNLSNENIVHVKHGDIEYIQFKKLLEYSNVLTHCFTLKPLDFAGFDNYEENKEKILICPAAKMMHHNYIGGLMIHTLECLKYAEVNLQAFFQKLNQDEVFAACLLHDIGKIFEYTVNTESGLIDYDENFRKEWISHSQYGFSVCMTAGYKRIAKMIAAHHARAEWGAIVDLNEKDLEPFVYLIHHIDDLSAKFGMTNVAMLG